MERRHILAKMKVKSDVLEVSKIHLHTDANTKNNKTRQNLKDVKEENFSNSC